MVGVEIISMEIDQGIFVHEQSFGEVVVRGGIVVGSKEVLLIDPLIFPNQTEEVLNRVTGSNECLLVYSHADWDHIWGASGLRPKEVVAHRWGEERFSSGEVLNTLREYQQLHPCVLDRVQIVPPNRYFSEDLTLDLGDLTVELRHCPGHTRDSLVAYVPQRGVFFGADCIETPLPLLNEGVGYLQDWIDLLSELAEGGKILTCIPSHGDIGGIELIRNNLSYLRSLLNGWTCEIGPVDQFYADGHEENKRKVSTGK